MTTKLHSVAGMAETLGVNVPTLRTWLTGNKGMPEPTYSNERGLQPLWDSESRARIIHIGREYMATPRF